MIYYTCIRYINRRSLSIFRRLSALSTEDIALCDVVKFELNSISQE
jgi:tRNA(fMet)-specific endonuclease VapC